MDMKLLQECAVEVLMDDRLRRIYPGYDSIVDGLISDGTVRFAKVNIDLIKKHFEQFPFVEFDGEVPDAYNLIQFTFDMEMFRDSDSLKEHLQKKAKQFAEEAEKFEQKAFRLRKMQQVYQEVTGENRIYFLEADESKAIMDLAHDALVEGRFQKPFDMRTIKYIDQIVHGSNGTLKESYDFAITIAVKRNDEK